uniref:Putative recombination endonuclease VII n=1 Tax=viral metagenome TaxID=1070528 RepID=A0A6M3LAQ0_9ZZZZ
MKDENVKYIMENYQTKTDKELANILNVHPSTVKQCRLGLRLLKNIKDRRADCHPDSDYYALGLCRDCYEKRLRLINFGFANRQRINSDTWHKNNKEWIAKYSRQYIIDNKSIISKRKWLRHIEKKYDISEDDYLFLLKDQSGVCAICGELPEYRLVVDHDHTTGKVRGLLCRQCNLLLGLLGDDINKTRIVISYLEKYNEQ